MSAFRKSSPKTSPDKLIADGETCISHPKKYFFFFIIDPKRAVSFETWYKPVSKRNEAKKSLKTFVTLGAAIWVIALTLLLSTVMPLSLNLFPK